jgi:mannitol-1-phosphate 5-dehydrogenase
MKTAVQFGAGNIGRSFMGQLFWETGYRIIFVDVNKEIVDLVNKRGKCPILLLDAYENKEIHLSIDKINALHVDEKEKIADAISNADIVSTAVGVRNLVHIAPLIAGGLMERFKDTSVPLDIYLCENALDAPNTLKTEVFKFFDSKTREIVENKVGFVGTVVARMVDVVSDRSNDDPLGAIADAYHKFPIDGKAIKTKPPDIKGLKVVRNFQAEFERKFFTLNLGHASIGYLGYLKNYTYVNEAIKDKYLSAVFDGVLNEARAAMLKKYPEDLDPYEYDEVIKDIKIRFGNPMFFDTIKRIARDPVRKLGPEDRLIGSAKLCLSYGIFPENIAYVCGAALCYDFCEDINAVELQRKISEQGIEKTLEEVSGVDSKGKLGRKIIKSYLELQKKRKGWKNYARDKEGKK